MNIKNLIFGIAIFLLTLFVGIYGVNTFYGKGPAYDDYCRNAFNEASCVSVGGTWINNTQIADGKPVSVGGGYCEYDYTACQKDYDNANEKYWRGVFFIALPLGILIIVLGAIIFGLEFVGAGLMFGGLGILIYGVGGFWRFAQDWLKFIFSLIGLVIIIYFAYWFNRKHGKKFSHNHKKK